MARARGEMGIETNWLNPPKNLNWLKSNWDVMNFDLSIQRRGGRWADYKQSMLIHSILYGYQVPPIYCVKNTDEDSDCKYDVIDGRQRMETVNDYINDRFMLHKDIPLCLGEEIAGKKFSELSPEAQNKLYMWCFSIMVFENITEDEIEEQFLRINDGEEFAPMEYTRARAGGAIRTFLDELSRTSFWGKVNFSKGDIQTYTDQAVGLQLLSIEMGKNNIEFSTKDLRNISVELRKTGISDEIKENLLFTLEYLDEAFGGNDTDKISKKEPKELKLLKKIHIPGIYVTAKQAIEDDLKAEVFGDIVIRFLKEQNNNRALHSKSKKDNENNSSIQIVPLTKYNDACSSGSAKRDAINDRIDELGQYYYNITEGMKEQQKETDKVYDENTYQVASAS